MKSSPRVSKPKKKKKPQLVEVVWEDAQDLPGTDTWVSKDEARVAIDRMDNRVFSTGYNMGTRKGHLALAGAWTLSPEETEDWYSSVQLIPSGWIKEIKVIKK